MLATSRQLDYSFGDRSHGGVFAVNEAQSVQGIFECGGEDSDFFRREGPTSETNRPNRHNTNPTTRTSTTSTSWLKDVMGITVTQLRIERVLMSIASALTRPSPKWQEGRHPHCHFRGSGFTHVTARRIAQPPKGDLCHEAPTHAVTRTSRSSATGSIDNSPGEFFLH